MTYRAVLRTLVLALAVLGAGALSAAAQTTDTASIEGKVTDESGAVMPGVTVTISSPALQARQVAIATDVTGNYRFTALPGGTYAITYELSGFQTTTRSDVRIAAGFAAKIDM